MNRPFSSSSKQLRLIRRIGLIGLIALLAPLSLKASFPPVIFTQPGDVIIPLGGSLNLTVGATPTPLLYQWRLNGKAIPNATNDNYSVPSVQTSDLGNYSVIVYNAAGLTLSSNATVTAIIPLIPPPGAPHDNWVNSINITSVPSPIRSDNAFATREAGEPEHVDKFGTNSVWYHYIAPQTGILTVSATGSTFDTLLAVYTGTSVSNLTEKASDDDRGGFFTSSIRFNVTAGVTYYIAVDSLRPNGGAFVLDWSLAVSPVILPVIDTHPASRSVPQGSNTTLKVTLLTAGPDTYQWYFKGTLLPGETASSYVIPSMSSRDVGDYFCRLNPGTRREIDSRIATVEMGPHTRVYSRDKLLDMRSAKILAGGGGTGGGTGGAQGTGGAFQPIGFPVSAGLTQNHVINNENSTTGDAECFLCNLPNNATRWFFFYAQEDGFLTIDTIGTTPDTVLAVYLDTLLEDLCDNLLACDTNSAPGGKSQVSLFVQANTQYIIGIDTLEMEGNINLNFHHCPCSQPPFRTEGNHETVLTVEPLLEEKGTVYYWTEGEGMPVPTQEPELNIGPITSMANHPTPYSVLISNGPVMINTNLGSVVRINSRVHEGMFQVSLTEAEISEFRLEVAFPDQTNCFGNWQWCPVEDPVWLQNGNEFIYQVPMNSPWQLFRLRPRPPPLLIEP